MPRQRRIALDVVRADVLLWSLQQFADPPIDAPARRALPSWLRATVTELAAKPRCAYGELIDLAETAGIPAGTLKVHVYHIRHGLRREPYY